MTRSQTNFDPAAPHFYRAPTWPQGVTFCSDNLTSRILSGRRIESDVTRILSFFDGKFADEIAQIFFDLCNVHRPECDVEIWVGSEWLSAAETRKPDDRRSPDIIVTARDDIRKVLLIIEVKGRAWVNGGWDYCAVHEKTIGYSNQIICYMTDCWTTADLTHVPRLVIGPDSHQASFGGWGRKGLTPQDITRNIILSRAFKAQNRAIETWNFAALGALEERIENLRPSEAREVLLHVLSPWIDQVLI